MSWNWRTGGEILSSIQILSAWFTPNCPWSPGQSWGKKRMLMMSVVKSDHVFKKMSEKVWKWKVSPGKKNSDVKTFHFPMSGWRKRYLHGSMWKLLDMVFQNYLTWCFKITWHIREKQIRGETMHVVKCFFCLTVAQVSKNLVYGRRVAPSAFA